MSACIHRHSQHSVLTPALMLPKIMYLAALLCEAREICPGPDAIGRGCQGAVRAPTKEDDDIVNLSACGSRFC